MPGIGADDGSGIYFSNRGLVPTKILSHVEPHEIGGLPSSNRG